MWTLHVDAACEHHLFTSAMATQAGAAASLTYTNHGSTPSKTNAHHTAGSLDSSGQMSLPSFLLECCCFLLHPTKSMTVSQHNGQFVAF
jgi:hypothetical protein